MTVTERPDPTPLAPRGRRRIAPFIALALALVLGGLFVVLARADPDRASTADSPLLGRPAPEARGVLDDGTPWDLSRRKGSWVVLNFFTSDCRPCIKEHPELISFVDQQRALGSAGAEFYSVVVADRRERVEEFFAERGGDWPVVYPVDDSAIDVAFGVALVPETWVVDPNGFVRARIISDTTAEQLGTLLRQLREGSA